MRYSLKSGWGCDRCADEDAWRAQPLTDDLIDAILDDLLCPAKSQARAHRR
jgi:hypothetical protein